MTRTIRRRQALQRVSLGLGAGLMPSLAFAQSTDTKPLRLILPVGAGSGVDAATRAVSTALARNLGAPVVIENMPGAGGLPGTQALVRAPKDGTVLGVLSNNHVVNPSVYKTLPYDSLADITPVMVIGSAPLVLVAHPSFAPRNLKEMVALAKSRPGQLNYASSGNGTIIQLAFEALKMEAGIFVTHIKSGALKALAVGSAQRTPVLPEVPTIAEQGYPNYDLGGWIAVAGPAGLPAAEVNRLHGVWRRTLESGEGRDALIAQGYQLMLLAPDASARFFKSEIERMAKIVKTANVKLD
jgi:tripartite-type tricarboxylate transporter receptor subunit TctC